MKRLIHFFSLAVMTQVILMLGQLILLPIQVRLWGQAQTALWYSALALATMTYFVDCGLRTAGHAELLKANAEPLAYPDECLRFRQIWSWIRILIGIVTALLITGDYIGGLLLGTGADASWHPVLILACAAETILIIRITYLDSLGRYRGAEASYFGFAILRLAFSIPALLVFHWRAPGLAAIYLVAAVAALLAQGHWLCRSISLLQLGQRFTTPSWNALALARHTVAEPIANWTRLSLPVLVISGIASPMAVTTYVALRAVFGAGRTTIQQLARVASVEVLKAQSHDQPNRAQTLLNLFLALAICFGSAVALFVIIDNLRMLGLWLKHFDRSLFQQVALAFALTAPFFSYQIPMNLLFRTGQLASVARRHYGFIACSLVFGAVSFFAKSLLVYLGLMVGAEVLLSISFFQHSGSRALRLASMASFVICTSWLAARYDVGYLFTGTSLVSAGTGTLLFSGLILALAAGFYWQHRNDFSSLRGGLDQTRPTAVLAK